MAAGQPEPSFGAYLKAEREKREIPLQEVSERTKIPAHVLRELERESSTRLPEAVYLKGFIRSYAETVGADPEEAMRLYRGNLPPAEKSWRARRERHPARSRFWPAMGICLVGFLGIILVSVVGMSLIREESASLREPDLKTAQPVQGTPRASEGPRLPESAASERIVTTPAGGYLLELKAVFDTWVQVRIDDHGPKEYRLKTGDHLALKAESEFLLHIGDVKGVIMQLNGTPFFIEGKSGESVRLKLP